MTTLLRGGPHDDRALCAVDASAQTPAATRHPRRRRSKTSHTMDASSGLERRRRSYWQKTSARSTPGAITRDERRRGVRAPADSGKLHTPQRRRFGSGSWSAPRQVVFRHAAARRTATLVGKARAMTLDTAVRRTSALSCDRWPICLGFSNASPRGL